MSNLTLMKTLQKLTREEILAFAIRENRILFDSQLYVDRTARECLNKRQVEIFRQRARLEESLDNEQLLQNLGCLKFQNHRPYLTFAGVLLFGEDPQVPFPQATITLLHMEDAATILEQKILKGPLFEQVENAYSFLKSHLRTRPEIRGLQREEVPEFPEPVLRELVVNAVVHRDYFEKAADITVKILRTQIEFSNPGRVSSTIPLQSLYGRSFRRNPLIADFFYRARYIERAGTGLLRVREILHKAGLPPLELAEEGPFFIATLFRPESLTALTDLNERQNRLFAFSADFFPFNTRDYARKFGVSERMARLDIQDLVKKGMLLVQREGRRIHYQRAHH